jgi:hypothetical protein
LIIKSPHATLNLFKWSDNHNESLTLIFFDSNLHILLPLWVINRVYGVMGNRASAEVHAMLVRCRKKIKIETHLICDQKG